jgi:hypothetical protein
MPRIEKTKTVKFAMFFLRAYLIFLFGLILFKGIGLFFAKDAPAAKPQEPTAAATPAIPAAANPATPPKAP